MRQLFFLSGWYPVYKVGVDDLGQQALYLRLSLQPSQEEGEPGRLEILVREVGKVRGREREVRGSEEEVIMWLLLQDCLAEAAVPPPASPVPEEEREEEQELKEVVFEARVVIHEALHLPLLKDTQ